MSYDSIRIPCCWSCFGIDRSHALSGYLAEPFGRVPVFGSLPFFKLHPYVLPGFVICGLSVISALAVLIVAPEVSSPHRHTWHDEILGTDTSSD